MGKRTMPRQPRLHKNYVPTPQEQMKNTEIANSKNKRIQKALQRQLYGAHGIETVKKMNISNLNDEKGFLEWELDRMHREAKKNALLAEAENEIMDVGDRNTQFLVQRLKPVFWNYIGIRHGGQFG